MSTLGKSGHFFVIPCNNSSLYNINRLELQEYGVLLGGCLTYEELSGGYSQEMMWLDLKTGIHFHNQIKKI